MTTTDDARPTEARPVAAPDTPVVRDLDVATLKALSHPLRVRLWDLLVVGGPATSTTLAQQTGESTGSTSYHLRTLARHGLIEEVPGRGTGRERWWRPVQGGVRVDSDRTAASSPAAGEAVAAFGEQWLTLRRMSLERYHDRVVHHEEPREWVDAATDLTVLTYLSREELARLGTHLTQAVDRVVDERREEPPGPGYRRIEIQLHAFPTLPPGTTDPGGPGATAP